MDEQSLKNGREGNSGKLFPIVAIGASAGGVEAARELFENLAPDTGMAFIHIVHLDKARESNLAAILGRSTSMKVTEATQRVTIEPNRVYIIPSNQEMTITDGELVLSSRSNDRSGHSPIDLFFSSLAEKQREGTIGILLSGAGNDGAAGLKSIKAAGGITFVQNDSAQFQNMPDAAIAEGIVDMILRPADIAKELVRISGKVRVLLDLDDENEEPPEDSENIKQILHLVKKASGADFFHYKVRTIRRRIIRRMLLVKLEDLSEYLTFLTKSKAEVNALYADLLINVTAFFRDPDTLEYLTKAIIPKIIKDRESNDTIRIWVPACSTGEEAYTLAILFTEALGANDQNVSLQIFATDLSEQVISKARMGIYQTVDIANIDEKRLQKYFIKTDGSYRVVKALRDICVFAPHNVFKDPPFSRMDLISCCNLMIYLDVVLQKKMLNTFHYALKKDCFLILGKSETIGNSVQLFTQLEKKYRVYQRKGESFSKPSFELTYRTPEEDKKSSLNKKKFAKKVTDTHSDLERVVDTILLSKYIPASVVVNHELEILQFRGSTGLFLDPSPGRASLNLLKMAKTALTLELRNAIHKASKEGQPVRRNGIPLQINEHKHLVQIEVLPIKSDSEDRLFLVVFEKMLLPHPQPLAGSDNSDKALISLENELSEVKDDMRAIIEEQEASNEELQSANEEIVSSNEELQSINEELETAKEELESTNEELMTINSELQMRNEQLSESYDYAQLVFDTVGECILVLDKELRVRAANKAFEKVFKVKEEAIEGKPFFEILNSQWKIPQMIELLQVTIPRDGQHEGITISHQFEGIGEKTFIVNCCRLIQKVHQQQVTLIALQDITGYVGN